MNLLKVIKFKWLLLFSYLITVIIAWSYGGSYIIYAASSIFLMCVTYFLILRKSYCAFPVLKTICIILVLFTCFLGLLHGDIQSPLMVNTSLLLPIAIASLRIDTTNIQRQLAYASILSVPIIMYIGIYIKEWNSNSLAFIFFGGVSLPFLWFKFSNRLFNKLLSGLLLLFFATYLLATGSRNAGIVLCISIVLLLLPNSIYRNKILFRILYLIPLFSTVFAESIMAFVFNTKSIIDNLVDFTAQYSQKAWGMDTHLYILLYVRDKFLNLDIFTQLFGSGVKAGHCHNIFYQCLFFYGFLGTVIIYMIYMRIFEYAYKLIYKYNDSLVLGCFIILLGHFYLQIGEVYMLGAESANVISLLPVGIILQRLNYYKSHGNINSNSLLQT